MEPPGIQRQDCQVCLAIGRLLEELSAVMLSSRKGVMGARTREKTVKKWAAEIDMV